MTLLIALLITVIEYGKIKCLGSEPGEKLNWRRTKFALTRTCSFQKVILVLAFSSREKFDN